MVAMGRIGMGMGMTIIMARDTTGVFGGRMHTYSGITITADTTTILDGEATRVAVPGVGFTGDFTEGVDMEEAVAFTEAVAVVMEGAAMGDDGWPRKFYEYEGF